MSPSFQCCLGLSVAFCRFLLYICKELGGGRLLPHFYYFLALHRMINKNDLKEFVESQLVDSDLFLVDISIDKNNCIVVEVDSMESVDIDTCANLNRAIEEHFDGDIDDYQLEVGSAGLTSPFKVKAQYEKNLGNEVEVLTSAGEKLKGVLSEVGDDSFAITIAKKVKRPGEKRPVMVEETVTLNYNETKYTKYLIQFK